LCIHAEGYFIFVLISFGWNLVALKILFKKALEKNNKKRKGQCSPALGLAAQLLARSAGRAAAQAHATAFPPPSHCHRDPLVSTPPLLLPGTETERDSTKGGSQIPYPSGFLANTCKQAPYKAHRTRLRALFLTRTFY